MNAIRTERCGLFNDLKSTQSYTIIQVSYSLPINRSYNLRDSIRNIRNMPPGRTKYVQSWQMY